MLTLNTELQYKKSRYESLYSMRIKKFLSAKCPVWSCVCHVDDAADCTAVSPSTGAGAVRAGLRGWFEQGFTGRMYLLLLKKKPVSKHWRKKVKWVFVYIRELGIYFSLKV